MDHTGTSRSIGAETGAGGISDAGHLKRLEPARRPPEWPTRRALESGRVRRVDSSLRRALLVSAAAALVPGIAHLFAGRTRTGVAMIAGWGLLVSGGTFAAVRHRDALLELAVRPGSLAACVAVAVIAAIVWAALIGWSYLLVRPALLTWRLEVVGVLAVAGMCLVAAAPPLMIARYAYLQRDMVTSVFTTDTVPIAGSRRGRAHESGAGGAQALPRRLNILLLGGDADVGRPGLRTDSMTLASIDTATGTTTLLSVPRNLQHVPVWGGRHRVRFPQGELLNEVYEFGLAHPRVLDAPHGGRRAGRAGRDEPSRHAAAAGRTSVRNTGAELLKRTVGHILGMPVAYYGMVDMRSFRQLVDAVGGVRVCVRYTVPVPRQQVPAGVLRPGCQMLTGREALWYGRSRTGSDDFSRMARQKCLMWALARQASPLTVLRRFRQLAHIFKYSVNTDIPRGLLPSLVALSGKVRRARITSIQFVPPLISTGHPDYAKIRWLARAAVGESARTTPRAPHMRLLNETCGA
jgi:LCP family protein required for cell wall assembly